MYVQVAGVVVLALGIFERFGFVHCTVYQVEILAIIELSEWLRLNILSKNIRNIFSDR